MRQQDKLRDLADQDMLYIAVPSKVQHIPDAVNAYA